MINADLVNFLRNMPDPQEVIIESEDGTQFEVQEVQKDDRNDRVVIMVKEVEEREKKHRVAQQPKHDHEESEHEHPHNKMPEKEVKSKK